MPTGAAVLGGSLISGAAGIFGAGQAAKAQTAAANAATNAELNMFYQAQANQAPFIQAGKSALPTLESLLTPGPNQTATLSQLPGFQFAQDWGNWAAQSAGTTRGLGGNVLTAAQQYATGLAQQGFGNYVGQVQGLANMGSNSASSLTGAATQVGGQIGGNIIGAGNAQAGANIAQANALGGVGNSLSNFAMFQQLLGNKNMYQNNQNAFNGYNTTGGTTGPE